jgi:hypothetical protein
MHPRRAAILAAVAIMLAGCQQGAAPAGATQPGVTNSISARTSGSSPIEPDSSAQAQVSALDGSITYTSDSMNGSADSFTQFHKSMSLTVHLVGPGDGGPGFSDRGSTFIYSETSRSHDAQRVGSCGLDIVSSGSGSGPFAKPGLLVGYYSYLDGTVSIGVHAPYKSDGKSTFLCNGLTNSGTTDEIERTSCGDPSGGDLVGKVEPGNLIDFSCSESMAIGTGGVVVKGTLTSR